MMKEADFPQYFTGISKDASVTAEVRPFVQRNWVFATNYDFQIPISLRPNVVDLRYFKL